MPFVQQGAKLGTPYLPTTSQTDNIVPLRRRTGLGPEGYPGVIE